MEKLQCVCHTWQKLEYFNFLFLKLSIPKKDRKKNPINIDLDVKPCSKIQEMRNVKHGVGEAVQPVIKAFAAKADDLSLIARLHHLVQDKDQFPQTVF